LGRIRVAGPCAHGDELVVAPLTGRAPPGKSAHVSTALDDISPANLAGLVDQVSRLSGDPGRVVHSF